MTRAALLTPRSMLVALVALPMLLAALYYTVLAQNRFVSTSVVAVHRAGAEGLPGGGLATLLAGAGGGGGSREDAFYLREYVRSLGLMKKVDAALNLRAHYEAAPTDPFFRLWPQSSQEWMLEYWRSRVDVQIDEPSGLVTLRIEGFEPAFAQSVHKMLLAECEAFVNGISQRIAREQMDFVQGELTRAGVRLQQAEAALTGFQARHQMLDPTLQAQATGTLVAELRAQLAKAEAELTTKRAYLNDDAADLTSLKNQVAGLRAQIGRESRSATQQGSAAINELAVRFHELKSHAGFAQEAYKTSLIVVEKTRVDAARKVKSLVVVEPPTLPERAEYPRRLYNLLTVLIAGLLLYAVARLGVAVVHEHRD